MQHVYLSEGNSVQIQVIAAPVGTKSQEEVLLHYEGKQLYLCISMPCASISL